jgi:hypothetical protein
MEMSAAPQITEPRTTTMKIPSVVMPSAAAGQDDEPLHAAQALLEREVTRPELGPAAAEALREVLFGIREQNYARVGTIYRAAFAELTAPSDALRQAFDHLERFFGKPAT